MKLFDPNLKHPLVRWAFSSELEERQGRYIGELTDTEIGVKSWNGTAWVDTQGYEHMIHKHEEFSLSRIRTEIWKQQLLLEQILESDSTEDRAAIDDAAYFLRESIDSLNRILDGQTKA